jgi:hypothetical protein
MSNRRRQIRAITDAEAEMNEAASRARDLLAARYRDEGMLAAARERRDQKLPQTFPELKTHMPEPAPVVRIREVPGGGL